MALDLKVTYEGQVVDDDPDYPQGKARNIVVEGDGIGTPWEEQLVNDWLGFYQALLLAANITPSGDPDHANESQYLEAVGWVASSANATFDPCHPLFGAVGEIITETEDDTAALNACFAAAYAAIGGGNVTVDLAGRSYRVTGALAVKPHVTVKNGKIVMYHASANMLVFGDAATQRTVTVWENVELAYAEANSGIIISNPAAAVKVAFRNCHFNESGFCTGRLFHSPAASDFYFDAECRGKIPINNPGFRSDAGLLHLRGSYATPLGYVDSVVQGTGGVHDVAAHFDTRSTTGGGAVCIQMAGQTLIAIGNHFQDSENGNHAIQINDGGLATIKANRYDMIPFVDDSNTLGLGSDVDLVPHSNSSLSGAAFTVERYYRTFEVYSGHTAPPVGTLKVPVFLGQEVEVAVRNVEGNPWSGAIGFTSSIDVAYTEAGGLTDLAHEEIATIRFRAMRLGAADKAWVQIGAAAQHFVAS